MKPLFQAVLHAVDAAGGDWGTLRNERVRGVEWERPSFWSRRTVQGVAIQDYARVQLDTGIDTVADVYESFVAGYIDSDKLHGTDPSLWVSNQLGLTQYDRRWLFPWNHRRSALSRIALYQHLLVIAGLIAQNFAARVEHISEASFVVHAADLGMRFGLSHGQYVSNLSTDARRPLASLSAVPDVTYVRRGRLSKSRDGTAYDALKQFVTTRRSVFREPDAVIEALTLMRWRDRQNMIPRFFMNDGDPRGPLLEALAKASEFMQHEDPVQYLYHLLVPRFMQMPEFRQRFSTPYKPMQQPISDRMQQKFRDALRAIASERK
jgi:hypothetical protein